ncbi:Uncharacterized protein AArcCO_0815 [Halalkaliarchaeum sp. AArc-CO]|uniref:hypothetical protein n=1 Tax=unclassified Halalkaliarchaeum TaxID=2678344 RepID=UPI00217DFE6D|nr:MULTISPECIES: hypothetical protein [unclassified Halalkaliarchaeum]MDR5672249.1 hypothetical protein [Halalkaliarchaeum sp. AArc-GB]UWG50135.1 Uncharacterized protein AArcCO_0815 [Halalkaliarchaeum sp. AArc-CO]
MYTPAELVIELVANLWEMIVIIATEVALADPLSTVAVAGGAAFITVAVVVFLYAAIGAVLAEVGIRLPRIGDGQSS